MYLKKILNAFTLCTALVCTCLNAQTAFSEDTIRIGFAGALSGELASYGVPTYNAALLVAEEFNAKGGLLGKKVEIIPSDDACKPELAPNVATSLISQNVVAVIGLSCSGPTVVAAPIFEAANTLLISSSATIPSLTLSGENKLFFRTIPHFLKQADAAVKFIGEVAKPKTVALLHDNSEYSMGLAGSMREKLESDYKEIKIVLYEAITPGASDYSATVRKLRKEGAEFLVWGGYLPEAAKLLSNMKSLGVEIPMIGAESLKDDNFLLTAGEDAENSYAAAPAETNDNPLSQKATQAHIAKYGSNPGAYFDNGYAAAYVIMNAIEKAGSTDTDKLVEVLRTEAVDTPVGTIKFDENGDAEGIALSVYQVQNGKFVPVYSD